MKQGITVVAFALLAAIGTAGWLRNPAELPSASDPALTAQPANYAPVASPAVYRQPAAVERAARVQPASVPARPAVKRGRPLSHSVAIVAGGAGVGAAIGGLAGGEKGAAIGALSGGAAGFIYDRITHSR